MSAGSRGSTQDSEDSYWYSEIGVLKKPKVIT